MMINGTVLEYTKSFRGRDQIALLVTSPADVLKIDLDENESPDQNLIGREIEVGVQVGAYKDRVQYSIAVPPKVKTQSAAGSPPPGKS